MTQVYDKAKYHFQGNFPSELPIEQAYVHTGMFLGWLIENNLFSPDFEEDFADLISQLKHRQINAARLYQEIDGVLDSDMLNDTGNNFAQDYFDFETGKFLDDYEEILASNLPTIYHVKDTWENYELLKNRLEQRFDEWKNQK